MVRYSGILPFVRFVSELSSVFDPFENVGRIRVD